jgi:galactokinase
MNSEQFAQDFQERFGHPPRIFAAPGRVNLIGEHTDYNEGFVMPFAIDRVTLVGIAPRSDDLLNVYTLTLNEGAEIRLDNLRAQDRAAWTKYIAGMAEVLRAQGLRIGGADLMIDSDIPFGAGLSSSAALETALGRALADVFAFPLPPLQLALAGQKVEHDFIGVRSGLMDQLASGLSREANAMLLDCRTLDIDYIPLNLGTAVLAVCDSRIKHELAASAYNERRQECEEAVKLLSEKVTGMTALRDLTPESFAKLESLLPENVKRRCRHVVTENERTLSAADALRSGNLTEAGQLMNQSHESLRDDYEVSCPELDLLVETASKVPNVYGARMTGGGFGGCTINILERSSFEEFNQQITAEYTQAFDRKPEIFIVKASEGAHPISLSA